MDSGPTKSIHTVAPKAITTRFVLHPLGEGLRSVFAAFKSA
jgi:hypothetical protein